MDTCEHQHDVAILIEELLANNAPYKGLQRWDGRLSAARSDEKFMQIELLWASSPRHSEPYEQKAVSSSSLVQD